MATRKPKQAPTEDEVRARTEATLTAGARVSFTTFVYLIHHALTNERFSMQPFHGKIIEALESCYRHERRRLIISLPPRSGKTTLVNYFVAWTLGRHPDSNNIMVSATGDLAERNSLEVQSIIGSAKYREIFPGTAIPRETSARDDWSTGKGGRQRYAGVGGQVIGYGGGKDRTDPSVWGGMIVFDDPHKPVEIGSKAARDEVAGFFTGSVMSRRNSAHTPMIVIAQRLDQDDLTGRLLEGLTGEAWHQVVIPGLNERDESFWERRFPAADLRVMRDVQPREFWSQIQQDPAPPGGITFKVEAIPVIDQVPEGASIAWCRGWDLAATTEGDWTVGALVGRYSRDGGSRYVLADVVRVRGTPDHVRDLILKTAQRDGRGVKISLPEDPGQAGKAQAQSMVAMLAGYIVDVKNQRGSKEVRAEPLASAANVGLVSFVRGAWNAAALDELRSFPGGRHDDIVDAMASAFNFIAAGALDPGHFAAIGKALNTIDAEDAPARTPESYMPGLVLGGPGHVLAQVIEAGRVKPPARNAHREYFDRIRANYQADQAALKEAQP
jgi:predicted phage terminase large subunit-like protein